MFDKQINWIIKKSGNKIDRKEVKEGLVSGLVGGLAFGLVGGLIFGLAFSLAFSLVFSLAFGLVFSLAFSLAFGLVFSLAFSLVFSLVFSLAFGLVGLISLNLISLFIGEWSWIFFIIMVISILILGEVIFLLDKKKPKKKDNKFNFTAKRKGVALLISGFIITQIVGIINNVMRAIPYIKKNGDLLIRICNYVGSGVVGLFILVSLICIYIALNSLKYEGK